MSTEFFEVACHRCGRSVAVRSVSEHHFALSGFCGYSFRVECECGAICRITGADGENIPVSLKEAAAIRRRAFDVLHVIDFQRRELPTSDAKRRLKEACLRIPEMLDQSTWLVYRFEDGTTVSFSPETGTYTLRDGISAQSFSSVNDLVSALAD